MGEIEHSIRADRMAVFANYIADGYKVQDAARLAGYAAYKTEGSRLLARPDVQVAIAAQRARLFNADANLARLALRDIVTDKGAKNADRIKAAQVILSASGDMEKRGDSNDVKPLHMMTPDELEDMIRKEKASLAALESLAETLPNIIEVEAVEVQPDPPMAFPADAEYPSAEVGDWFATS
jgi:phage terminase small subunit